MACVTAVIQIIMLFAFTMFNCFLPNRNVLPSNFWQQIPHTVGCIQANKPSFTSCFSGTFTIFYSPTWNTQLSKFWQQIALPILLALADYWSQQVWIIKSYYCYDHSQLVIDWIAHGGVWWANTLPADSAGLTTMICLTWLISQVYILWFI